MAEIIWKNKSSREIEGLIITNTPPITKPKMRVDKIEIDGRDGDIIEKVGYESYDKNVGIGLTRNYDINEVINYSTQDSRCVVDISVSYNSDLDKVEKVLQEVCQNLSKKVDYLTSDVEILGIEKLDDSAILYRLIADCKPTMDRNLKREIYKEVKKAFDKNKIEIPFPQVVVHSE